MIVPAKLIPVAILLAATCVQISSADNGRSAVSRRNTTLSAGVGSDASKPVPSTQTPDTAHRNKSQKYSSKITGSRYASNHYVFGIRTFPFGKSDRTKTRVSSSSSSTTTTTTETVLDFRIQQSENEIKRDKDRSEGGRSRGTDDEDDDDNVDDDEQTLDRDDLVKAPAGGGKQKKEAAEDEEEKTLSQQVADGKYGLIQNELFANGSKRPGILSYRSNNEVPKDTKENLGGLEKDEIWLAEDHILVLRGGNYDKDDKENEAPPQSGWPPIDDYKAPNRQVKIPKNPEIPPPFPVQLSEDGPVQFIKGQKNPSFLPPIIPPLPPFAQESNKTIPLPFTVVPIPPGLDSRNKSLPFPVPPQILPPFLNNLPPGATFVAPPENQTEIDEDDPSIYYPPKYDFIYPVDNSTAVPPGPLVPGIILPPPPDFFSLLDNKTESGEGENDDSINSVKPNTFFGPKYLPTLRKPGRTRISASVNTKRPTTGLASNVTKGTPETHKPDKPGVTYVYPENAKHKPTATNSVSQNGFRTNQKAPANKYPSNNFNSPIYVPSNRTFYHYPLPTTSPKPNHITLPPTTKSLPKQILIITTPETVNKNRIENVYKKPKPAESPKYENINPEIHPLRSLIKPNVTVSYNGKYGHLPPPPTAFQPPKPAEGEVKIIRGHYVTQPPLTKASKVPSTDLNSITVTPVPVVKKVRIQSDKPETSSSPNPSKATLYFYEEASTTEEPPRKPEKPAEPAAVDPPSSVSAKPEAVKPVTPYHYTTHSTSKTPIRQFLEETFHSSNILTRKPQITHVQNAEIITHNGYSDLPKMKHLNYGSQVSSPRPVVKYHYVTDGNPVVIPTPKIKDLEIKNSGSSGLQTVHLEPAPVRPAPQPIPVDTYVQQVPNPEGHQQPQPPQVVTPGTIEYNTADGPFIPSNYYATARPDHLHFTSQEQTLVDDITKNYFTIFGQKINNAPSTTPLAPIAKPLPASKPKVKPESGLTYISDDGHNFKIQQVHETSPGKKPGKSSSSFYTVEKVKAPSTRPPSNFEKYLKELTGEDQRDYIVSGVFPVKVKKGKGYIPDGLPPHFLAQPPIIFDNGAVVTGPKIQYQPNLSTTLRPVTNVEIKPQYVQHISSTSKPYDVYQSQGVRFNPSFQQYLQEITSLTSPTTKRPVKVKKPSLDYLPNPSYPTPDVRQKPIPLADDIVVNYKSPRPAVEPAAEVFNVPAAYDNIKIVQSPDLSRTPNGPYPGPVKQIAFDVGKVYFKPDFFPSRPSQNGGNSFVSYNLPGNSGHFYFLTPQIVDKVTGADQDGRPSQDKPFKRVNRSHGRSNQRFADVEVTTGYAGQISQNSDSGYSNRDYLRRRRKKS